MIWSLIILARRINHTFIFPAIQKLITLIKLNFFFVYQVSQSASHAFITTYDLEPVEQSGDRQTATEQLSSIMHKESNSFCCGHS